VPRAEELVPRAAAAPEPAPQPEVRSPLLTKFRRRPPFDPDAVASRALDAVRHEVDEPPPDDLAIRLLSHF
jgi:hypothetical protein